MRTSIASGPQAFRGPVIAAGSLRQRGLHVVGAALFAAALLWPGAGDRLHAQLASEPRQPVTAITQASRLYKEGRAEDALKALDVGLKESPRDPQMRFLYGVILNERGRAGEALDVFQQLTEDFPELPEPYNNLAVLLAARGDLDQARTALEAAVRALPSYSLAHENLGDVYLRMAVRAYERAGRATAAGDAARNKLMLARELLARVIPGTPVTPSPPGGPSTATPK